MRFVVYGGDRLGVLDGPDVVDVTDLAGAGPPGPAGPLQRLIEAGRTVSLDALDARQRTPLATALLRPPLPRPSKVIGAPVNYAAHQAEMAAEHTIAGYGVFLKAPSSVIGPGQAVRLPYTDRRTDHEGELAVVIGRTARHVTPDDALSHVFGYTCGLDVTVRSTEDRSTRKSFDTFCPLGPAVVTADEVGDPGRLELRLWVGDELRQHASTSDMIFDVPLLVAYASSVMTLLPGDVILTGTPAGVGPLAAGDRVAVEVERVGRLEVAVSDEGAVPYAQRPGRGPGS